MHANPRNGQVPFIWNPKVRVVQVFCTANVCPLLWLRASQEKPLEVLPGSWHTWPATPAAPRCELTWRCWRFGTQWQDALGWAARLKFQKFHTTRKKKKTWLLSPQGKQFEPWTCTNPTLMILGSQNLGPRPESINHLAGQCWHMCSRKGNLLKQNAATYFTGIIGTLHIFVAFCCYVFVANAPMPIIPQTSASRHPFGCSGSNCTQGRRAQCSKFVAAIFWNIS
jgi:hypothetical protein